MEKIIVRGGKQLKGTVKAEGAKNAVLPILAGALLAESGEIVLENTPILADVFVMQDVLKELNVASTFDKENNVLTLTATAEPNSVTPYELMNKMRASVIVMGPLLARNGYAEVAMPGGCAIGSRPIDLHLKGFEALGATIEVKNGYMIAQADKLVGTDIYLDFPSVGATENIMMAAVLAEGTTVIENVAREPEIVDLANFLNKMGAKIIGAGTDTMRIEGVKSLKGTKHHVISDRIEAGTFVVAAAITQGDVFVEDFVVAHNRPLVSKLREMGVEITESENGVHVKGPESLKACNVETMPYPSFPTDLQSPMTVAMLLADGLSAMKETVFENRFMHLEELMRMGAEYTVDGQTAFLKGPAHFEGAEVTSTDLRAAAALILAGLRADGYTRVGGLGHLDRGYYRFTEKLQGLGADIERVDLRKDNISEVDYAKKIKG